LDHPDFTIVPAGWRDLRSVLRLERECFGEDAWPVIDILAVLTFPGVLRLKVLVTDQIAAFAAAEERDGAGWITTIGVAPAFRRRGLARALLAACEERLPQRRLRLCVRSSNEAAKGLYDQAGYHQMDVWKRYYRGGEDALVLEKIRG